MPGCTCGASRGAGGCAPCSRCLLFGRVAHACWRELGKTKASGAPSKRRSQQGAQVNPPIHSLPLDVGSKQLVAQPRLVLDSVLQVVE